MKKELKVSIIIPTIGRESLKETIECVINQTYKNLEIIITDDTEDKKAYPLVKSYLEQDERIKYTINTKYKHGPSGNKNNGLDHITGEYFTFCDDDDTIMPDAIEKLIKVAVEKNYDIVYANCVDQYGRYTGKHYNQSQEVYFQDWLCAKFDGEYSGIIRTSLLENERFIDECWGAEGILWFKLQIKAQTGYYLHETLKKYRYAEEDSVTKLAFSSTPDIANRAMLNYVYLLKIFFEDFKRYCPKQFFRYSIIGMFFASLGSNRKGIIWFLSMCYKASWKYAILALPCAVFCFIMPKKVVLKIWSLRKLKNFVKSFLVTK